MKKPDALTSQLTTAIAACQDKKAEDLTILQMDKNSGAFTDYFVICSGSNPRQIQAISDEVELRLKRAGTYPNNIEGYKQAEWVLLDYVDFVVHVFSTTARSYYDLERLWRTATKLEPAKIIVKPRRRVAKRKIAG
jgi:ribosome-associated protein